MKRSTTTLRLAALASASALVLAACGGGDESSDDNDKDVAKGDGEFVVGSLLPQTGSLAFLGPPEFAGVDLAVQEINEAGGVLGKDARHVKGDSGDTDSGIAPAEADKLIKAKADVIVGAASSGVSMTVIDKILGAGVVQYSPANTSTDFDEGKYAEPDLYFRTAPSDVLQGAVMANLLVEDGRQNVAILARQDSYGETLAEQVKSGLEAAGSKVAVTSFYGEKAPSYDAQVDDVAAAKPDAVVLIAFDETKKIIPQLVGKGVGPQDVATYFVDGNVADYSAESFAADLKGVKGTVPGAEATGEFRERLLAIDPKLKDYSYAAESYDAVITSALAAIAAGNDSGEAIASELVEVTKGGEKCTTFKQCADLLADDKDIDYDGVSGPIEMSDTGSPTSASIGIYEYDTKGGYKAVKYIAGDI
ncbi:ABC transporter substrate-binding protein [Aeromicrobium tamlense]|uniref:ABC transporter substrate-binding protein n=1 Tax=Aeromicrobium tamlense TaxID=375541 RepID=A0A8I0KMB0_9ACTN|nr:ABC transporter substrate-binding protein [Aeromicrobium tamlense]MBD1270968.1 ABC transporter substrate-binding protein [Aeromicrobium tamlense]NYI38360.1 branched-chain amino acid transport system substrate-binding protein [Aeromicrobium tamlense]